MSTIASKNSNDIKVASGYTFLGDTKVVSSLKEDRQNRLNEVKNEIEELDLSVSENGVYTINKTDVDGNVQNMEMTKEFCDNYFNNALKLLDAKKEYLNDLLNYDIRDKKDYYTNKYPYLKSNGRKFLPPEEIETMMNSASSNSVYWSMNFDIAEYKRQYSEFLSEVSKDYFKDSMFDDLKGISINYDEYRTQLENINNDITFTKTSKYRVDQQIKKEPYIDIANTDDFENYINDAEFLLNIKEKYLNDNIGNNTFGGGNTKKYLLDYYDFLTDEQRKMYAYLYSKGGKVEAEKYLIAIEDELNQQKGLAKAQKLIESINKYDVEGEKEYIEMFSSEEYRNYVLSGPNKSFDDIYNELLNERQESLNLNAGNIGGTRDIKKYNLIDAYEYLTDYDKELYAYLYNTQGVDAAEQYLETVKGRLNPSFSDYMKVTGKGILAGIENWGEGVNAVFETEGMMTDNQYAQMYILQALEGKGLLSNAYEISTSVGNMLPSIAASAIFSFAGAGATLFTVMGEEVSMASLTANVLMGASAMGNSKNEALIGGNDLMSSTVYGFFSGLSETSLGMVLGNIPGLNEGSSLSIMGLFKEGFEEFTQEYVSAGLKASMLGETTDLSDLTNDAIKSFIYGVITSGVMNGGQVGMSIVYNGVAYGINNLNDAVKFKESVIDTATNDINVQEEKTETHNIEFENNNEAKRVNQNNSTIDANTGKAKKNIEKMDSILKHLFSEKKYNEIDGSFVYEFLRYDSVSKQNEKNRTNIRDNLFNKIKQKYPNSVEMVDGFLHIFSRSGALEDYNYIKIYAPCSENEIIPTLNTVMTAIKKQNGIFKKNNVEYDIKIAKNERADNICIRVKDTEVAKKIINSLSSTQQSRIDSNPFSLTSNNLSIVYDGDNTFNNFLSTLISAYINNTNDSDVNSEKFLNYVLNLDNQLVEYYANISSAGSYKSSKGSANYANIMYAFLLNSLTTDNIDSYFQLYDKVVSEKINYDYESSKNLVEEVKDNIKSKIYTLSDNQMQQDIKVILSGLDADYDNDGISILYAFCDPDNRDGSYGNLDITEIDEVKQLLSKYKPEEIKEYLDNNFEKKIKSITDTLSDNQMQQDIKVILSGLDADYDNDGISILYAFCDPDNRDGSYGNLDITEIDEVKQLLSKYKPEEIKEYLDNNFEKKIKSITDTLSYNQMQQDIKIILSGLDAEFEEGCGIHKLIEYCVSDDSSRLHGKTNFSEIEEVNQLLEKYTVEQIKNYLQSEGYISGNESIDNIIYLLGKYKTEGEYDEILYDVRNKARNMNKEDIAEIYNYINKDYENILSLVFLRQINRKIIQEMYIDEYTDQNLKDDIFKWILNYDMCVKLIEEGYTKELTVIYNNGSKKVQVPAKNVLELINNPIKLRAFIEGDFNFENEGNTIRKKDYIIALRDFMYQNKLSIDSNFFNQIIRPLLTIEIGTGKIVSLNHLLLLCKNEIKINDIMKYYDLTFKECCDGIKKLFILSNKKDNTILLSFEDRLNIVKFLNTYCKTDLQKKIYTDMYGKFNKYLSNYRYHNEIENASNVCLFLSKEDFEKLEINKNTMAFNNGFFSVMNEKYFLDVLRSNVFHESLHQLSSKGKYSGVSLDGKFKGINECITEYLTEVISEELYPIEEYSGYQQAINRGLKPILKMKIDDFNLDAIMYAYFNNDISLLSDPINKLMGNGWFENKLAPAFDKAIEDSPSYVELEKLVAEMKLKKMGIFAKFLT